MTIGNNFDYSPYDSALRFQELRKIASKEEAVQSVQADSKVEANQKVLNSQISINDKEETSRTKPALELENISLGFQKNDTFDYIGSQRDLVQLDMEKAISDMKKDEVLGQYNFFVGRSELAGNIFESDDGIVKVK